MVAIDASIRNILTEQQLAILGEIAIASTQLEGTVGSQIAMTLSLSEEDAEIIVTPMNLSTRLDVLQKLGISRIRTKKRKEEFQKLITSIKGLVAQRNTVIHGWWKPTGRMRLYDMMAIWTGRFKPHGVRARSKNRVFYAENLTALMKRLRESDDHLFRIAVSSWLKNKYREADPHEIIEE